MKLIKFKKIGLDKYKVFFDETELILYEDVILKYNLLTTHDIDLQKIEKIIEENKYYEVYNMALKYIAIKLRSKNEIISFLEKKDIESKLIKVFIKSLKAQKYLHYCVDLSQITLQKIDAVDMIGKLKSVNQYIVSIIRC